MRSRYNLRIQSNRPLLSATDKKLSRVTKKSKLRHVNSLTNRRHSLRLKPVVNEIKLQAITQELSNKKRNDKHLCQTPKWRPIETEDEDETLEMTDTMDDDFDDEVLIRHHRLMLEERKDRKLYERYMRDQRTLRRLQCRRSHTAHLKESTRKRLLHELQRERRYTLHDKICAHLANHTLLYRHGCNIESNQAMNWTTLESEIFRNRHTGSIHELDVMIGNLKKVIHNSISSISKPRLSVRERQNQRLKLNASKGKEIHSTPSMSHTSLTVPTQLAILSQSARVPMVRFTDDQNTRLRTNNSQRLTCIQNVLSHQSNNNNHHQNKNTTNDTVSSRKTFLRSKSNNSNLLDVSSTKKRPLEKENCSIVSNASNSPSHSNIVLRTASPMVSIKYTSSTSSSRTYPNTRKHPIINNSLTTRRHTRLSANG